MKRNSLDIEMPLIGKGTCQLYLTMEKIHEAYVTGCRHFELDGNYWNFDVLKEAFSSLPREELWITIKYDHLLQFHEDYIDQLLE